MKRRSQRSSAQRAAEAEILSIAGRPSGRRGGFMSADGWTHVPWSTKVDSSAEIGDRCGASARTVFSMAGNENRRSVAVLDSHVTVIRGRYGTSVRDNVDLADGRRSAVRRKIVKYAGRTDPSGRSAPATSIREFVTLNRGSPKGGRQGLRPIGDDNYLFMAYSHVAHDCHGRNPQTIFATTLRRSPVTSRWASGATIGAYSGVHQFCRVARDAFIGGYSVVTRDAMPWVDHRRAIAPRAAASTLWASSVGATRSETIDAAQTLLPDVVSFQACSSRRLWRRSRRSRPTVTSRRFVTSCRICTIERTGGLSLIMRNRATPDVRVAVVGVGHLGRHHARLYSRLSTACAFGRSCRSRRRSVPESDRRRVRL